MEPKNLKKKSAGARAAADGQHYQGALAAQYAIKMLLSVDEINFVSNHREGVWVDDILVQTPEGKTYYQSKDENIAFKKIKTEILPEFYLQYKKDLEEGETNNTYVFASTYGNKNLNEILDAVQKTSSEEPLEEQLKTRLTSERWKELKNIQEILTETLNALEKKTKELSVKEVAEIPEELPKKEISLENLVVFLRHVSFPVEGPEMPKKNAEDLLKNKGLPVGFFAITCEKMMGEWRGREVSKEMLEELLQIEVESTTVANVGYFFEKFDSIRGFLANYKDKSIKEIEKFLEELEKDTNLSWHFFHLLSQPELLPLIKESLLKPLLKNPIDRPVKYKIIAYLEATQSKYPNEVIELVEILDANLESPRLIESMVESFLKYNLDDLTFKKVNKIVFHLATHPNPFVRRSIAKFAKKIAEKDIDSAVAILRQIKGYKPDPKDLTMGGHVLALTFQGRDLEAGVESEVLTTLNELIPFKENNVKLKKILEEEVEILLNIYDFERVEIQDEFLAKMGSTPSSRWPAVSVETEWVDDIEEEESLKQEEMNAEDIFTELIKNPDPYSSAIQSISKLITENPSILDEMFEKQDISQVSARNLQNLITAYMKGINNDVSCALKLAKKIPDLLSGEVGLEISRAVFNFLIEIGRLEQNLSKDFKKKIEEFLEKTLIPVEEYKSKKDANSRPSSILTVGINSVRGVGIEILYLLLRLFPQDASLLQKLKKATEQGDLVMKCVLNYRSNWILHQNPEVIHEIIQKTQDIGVIELNYTIAGELAHLPPTDFQRHLDLITSILEVDQSKEVQNTYGELIGYRFIRDEFNVQELGEKIIKHRLGTIDCYLGFLRGFRADMPSLLESGDKLYVEKFREVILRGSEWKVPHEASHLFLGEKLDGRHFTALETGGLFDVFLDKKWIDYAHAHHEIVMYLKRCLYNGVSSVQILSVIRQMIEKGSPMLDDSFVAKNIAEILTEILNKEGESAPSDLVAIFDAGFKIGWDDFYEIYEKLGQIIKKIIKK